MQIPKKLIQANAVDGAKIRLLNNQALRGRNSANSADVDLLKLSAADIPTLPNKSFYAPIVLGLDPKEIVNVEYFLATPGVIASQNVVATAAFSTTSASDVLVTGMTATPVAGTYAVWVSSSWMCSNSSAIITASIYKDGAAVVDSVRPYQSFGASKDGPMNLQSVFNVNGAQAVDLRVKTSAGTLTVNGRSLLLIRLG